MHGLLIGQLVVEALVLGFLVRRVAPHNATADVFNMLLVIGGALLGGIFIHWGLADYIGSGTLAVQALLLAALLIMFSGTNPAQAGIITVVFFVVKIGLLFALTQWLS